MTVGIRSADQVTVGGIGRGGEEDWVIAPENRHHPGTGSTDYHHHAARTTDHVVAPDRAEIGSDQPGPDPEADETGGVVTRARVGWADANAR